MKFNLSQWALNHRSFTIYCMIALVLAGTLSYLRLGRNEDPAFTFRTMVVFAAWPGADLNETLKQVTERLERDASGNAEPRSRRELHEGGAHNDFRHAEGRDAARKSSRYLVPCPQKHGRYAPHLPAGVVGPGFNDEFGDTYGIIYGFTADGFSHRELRDTVEDIRSKLLQVPDVSKIELLGAQDEKIFVEFSTEKLAGLGVDRAALAAALEAQNIVVPAGTIQTGNEAFALRTSGAFDSEKDLENVTFVVNGRLIRLRDIATVRRGSPIPRSRCSVSMESPRSASPSRCGKAATSSSSAGTSKRP